MVEFVSMFRLDICDKLIQDPGKMKKPLFRLLYTVKMIFDVSTFYNSPERVKLLG